MAKDDENREDERDDETAEDGLSDLDGDPSERAAPEGGAADGPGEAPARGRSDDDVTPANLGATKYVHAAFFAFGVLVAYLSGKILGSVWNQLAEWPSAVRSVPQLLDYSEDERPTFTMLGGAVIGALAVWRAYRREDVRTYADEVALELSRCTWPAKDVVSNGTIVVCISTIVATVYVALLDRFWGFVTQLVYGV